MRLAVFVGGWTLEAAEAVCSSDTLREWEVLDLLTSLVEKSLVVYQPDEDRYRLLETIRQYLTGILDGDGAGIAIADAHLKYFLELAESSEPELTGPNQAMWMDRLEDEHDNVRAALNWARSHSARLESGLSLAGALWRFWDVRGHSREARTWLSTLLDSDSAREASAARTKALTAASGMAFRYGDIAASRDYAE